jgi:hypothetical protein
MCEPVAEELGTNVTGLLHDHIATPHNLPSPLTSFVGREKALTEIKDLFDTLGRDPAGTGIAAAPVRTI